MSSFDYKEKIHIFDSKVTVKEIIKDIVKTKDVSDPFYVFNVVDLVSKTKIWDQKLPRVKPYYSVKCNDNYVLLEILAAYGISFNCTTKADIKKVLSLGVNPSSIIFSNPAKMTSHIKFAMSQSVNLTTFDNEMELYKIKSIHPSCNLVLQICCDDTETQYPLGIKYGCDPQTEASKLLKLAYDLGLSVVGVSFHIGSGFKEAEEFRRAISTSATVFDVAKQLGFKNIYLLNIGGGFPGQKNTSLDKISDVINDALNEWFPPNNGTTIIAEPGKFFATSAFTLVTKIVSMEKHPTNEDHVMYLINDGVYGSFSSILFNSSFDPKPLYDYPTRPFSQCSVCGSINDDLKQVADFVHLPVMQIGEWIIFENMGAYSISVVSKFDESPFHRLFAIINEEIRLKSKSVMMLLEGRFTTAPIVADI